MNAPTRRAAFGVLVSKPCWRRSRPGVPALSLPAIAAVFADPVYTANDVGTAEEDTLPAALIGLVLEVQAAACAVPFVHQ